MVDAIKNFNRNYSKETFIYKIKAENDSDTEEMFYTTQYK